MYTRVVAGDAHQSHAVGFSGAWGVVGASLGGDGWVPHVIGSVGVGECDEQSAVRPGRNEEHVWGSPGRIPQRRVGGRA